jgi:hypothetical protein
MGGGKRFCFALVWLIRKKYLEANQFGSGLLFFLANLRICVLGQEICGFAICGLAHLRNLRIFALRNEAKNLRICELIKKDFVPTFAILACRLCVKENTAESVILLLRFRSVSIRYR